MGASRRNLVVALFLLIGTPVAASASAPAASAKAESLCVGASPGCFPGLQAAIAAAHDGDTIHIGPGTFQGGVTIDVGVRIVGAGAGRTVINGGGPVLTIGEIFAPTEPTVSIDGVTITGGVTRSSPESIPFVGQEGVMARGGGVEIPPNADFTGGATATITNSVITGNRVAPSATLPIGPSCPSGPCAFASAIGGGVDSWGTLTLDRTTISNNRIGSASGLSALASDAEGAGIDSSLAPLTITNSTISGNLASGSAPNGRFADGGAIFVGGRSLSMSNSTVSGNSAILAADLPNSVELHAHAGGIHVTDGATGATITGSTITGNSATMTNSLGDAAADSGGLHADIDVVLASDVISDNHVSAQTLPGSTGNVDGESGAGEFSGTFNKIRLTGNTVYARSAAGDASTGGGASVFDGGVITNGIVSDNHLYAFSPFGSLDAGGGGMGITSGLTLRNTIVSGNSIVARGASGSALGGGLNDDGGGPLALLNSSVTGNAVVGTAGLTVKGGGLYLQDEPLTLSNSVIAQNVPDQCFGCGPRLIRR